MNKELAIKIFFDHFPNLKNIKYKIKKIKKGFTNQSFLIKINQEKYQIRIGDNNNIVNRENELNALKLLNNSYYIYYDVKNGNSIKKWIQGKTLINKNINKKIIRLINEQIINLHQRKITLKVLEHNNLCFLENSKAYIDQKYLCMYFNLLKKNKNVDKVLSHNDLNLNNILFSKNQIFFIDFEWTRINYYYWDYANFIREADLSIDKIQYWCSINQKLNFNTLMEFVYMCTCFALQWTYATSYSKSLLKYRKKTLKKLEKYYNIINSRK